MLFDDGNKKLKKLLELSQQPLSGGSDRDIGDDKVQLQPSPEIEQLKIEKEVQKKKRFPFFL